MNAKQKGKKLPLADAIQLLTKHFQAHATFTHQLSRADKAESVTLVGMELNRIEVNQAEVTSLVKVHVTARFQGKRAAHYLDISPAAQEAVGVSNIGIGMGQFSHHKGYAEKGLSFTLNLDKMKIRDKALRLPSAESLNKPPAGLLRIDKRERELSLELRSLQKQLDCVSGKLLKTRERRAELLRAHPPRRITVLEF